MTIKKPSLAEDAILDQVQFPCWVQPKIDGVRAMNINGTLTGRSLDPFKGFGITEFFSKPDFVGLDGEMILGNKPNCTERLCSATTGAMGRIYEEHNKKQLITVMADLHWFVFDDLSIPQLPYEARYDALATKVRLLDHDRVHLVPFQVCFTMDDLEWWSAHWADNGYEGTIIRNPRAPFKEGRATQKGQELWRRKPWMDSEMLVTGVTEGNRNDNEAKKNSLGRTERSSAKDGLVPNGQIGSIQGTVLADIHCPITKKLLFPKDHPITISTGEMTVKEATQLFADQAGIVNHIVKFKHMTHGVKDQPRFGNYISHRLKEDMS